MFMALWQKKPKVYKGPIIDIRGMIRLVAAALPFLILGVARRDSDELWVLSFLCAAFTSASFVGFEKSSRRFRYALWVTGFVVLATFSAWQVSQRPLSLEIWLLVWAVASSLSMAGGPVISFPVNVGCMLYMLLIIGDRLEGASFGELIFYGAIGVSWSFFLGTVSIFAQRKNEITLPTIKSLFAVFKEELVWDSNFLRTGIARGALLVIITIFAKLTHNTALIITAFTVIISMQPGRSQTSLKVLSRVASAVGAVVAANVLLNIRPPFWVYIAVFLVGGVVLYIGIRWILLKSYTYNSFFLITFPLFVLSLSNYGVSGMTKVWYTLLGGMLAIITSELFVFHYKRDHKGLAKTEVN